MNLNDRMVRSRKPAKIGWQCPICEKINAPSVTACDHSPVRVYVPGGLAFVGTHRVESGEMVFVNGELQRS